MAEGGRVNPVAALLRCRQSAQLPGLTAALFGALRRQDMRRLAERLSDALMHMLVMRFGGDKTGERHERELRLALCNMEEPTMLAERVSQWRREAIDEGRRQGERALLRHLAAGRFGVATGDALAALLTNEKDVERPAQVGDLVVGCANAESCCGVAGPCSTAGQEISVRQLLGRVGGRWPAGLRYAHSP